MSAPSTAREALIAEAIGDIAQLLDRAEALRGAMTQSSQELSNAHAHLTEQLTQITAITEHAKVQAVKHILVRTDEAARRSLNLQTRAMNEAARALFKSELEPEMRRVATRVEQLAHRAGPGWGDWVVLAGTAAVSSALTWAVAAWLWTR